MFLPNLRKFNNHAPVCVKIFFLTQTRARENVKPHKVNITLKTHRVRAPNAVEPDKDSQKHFPFPRIN